MRSLELTWQQSLSQAVTELSELLKILELSACTDELLLSQAQKEFPIRVPREFVTRMEKGNPRDPLLLQVLPQAIEMAPFPGFSTDPLREKDHNPVPGLLHKYPTRVLLTLTGGCAIHCRYCFRRHFPYSDNLPGRDNWFRALSYIAENPVIDEVILSGGDPLVLKDHLLAEFVLALESIPHLKRLRIHTRLPIVIPNRITSEWIHWMRKTRFHCVIVFHSNHPNEIDASVIEAIKKLREIPVTLLNQSVLLKNINDDVNVLEKLSYRLLDAGVLPYYLHLLDKTQGAAHFEVSEEKAHQLMMQLKEKLPGYLVPKLAREVPNSLSKQY